MKEVYRPITKKDERDLLKALDAVYFLVKREIKEGKVNGATLTRSWSSGEPCFHIQTHNATLEAIWKEE